MGEVKAPKVERGEELTKLERELIVKGLRLLRHDLERDYDVTGEKVYQVKMEKVDEMITNTNRLLIG